MFTFINDHVEGRVIIHSNIDPMNFELCTDSVEGAKMAGKFGFKRIELCSALAEGGLSPSYGLIEQCALHSTAEVHAMIRPVGGGFCYTSEELEVMITDIRQAKKAGAKGVVFGILDPNKQVSADNVLLLQEARALGLESTFHRAFDQLSDPISGMEALIEMRFDRLLTSGLQRTAYEGLHLLSELQKTYGKRIQIMAGSGVNPSNAKELAATGITNLHFTARMPESELVSGMGQRYGTDAMKIRSILELFR